MFQNDSLLQMIIKGGPTMLVLAACSILSWVVIFERWWAFRKAEKVSDRLSGRVAKLVRSGKASEASQLTQSEEGSLAQVLHCGLTHPVRDTRMLEEAMQRRATEELLELESRLGILGTLGSISPYIGLFGTVIGIIRAFQALAQSTQAGAAVVSAGIAEALVCTAAGLTVAVPAVIAYNAFIKKLYGLETRMALASSELIEAFTDKNPRKEGGNVEA